VKSKKIWLENMQTISEKRAVAAGWHQWQAWRSGGSSAVAWLAAWRKLSSRESLESAYRRNMKKNQA